MLADILPFVLGAAASVATLAGGMLALRLGSRVHIVLGLAAGVVLGVALFDLLPEALAMGAGVYDTRTIMAALAAGLGAYMLLERTLAGLGTAGTLRSQLGPASLTLHSFLDGMGIGLAFQVSPAIGGIIAFAVLTHDVTDGVNTVALCLAGNDVSRARRWLAVNACAPLLGVTAAHFVRVPTATLALLLAVFGGAFLYIGSCELLPRSYAASARAWTSVTTLVGLAAMYGVTTLAGM